MKRVYCLIVCLLVASPGCGQGGSRSPAKMEGKDQPAGDAAAAKPAAGPEQKPAEKAAIQRKIQYTADVRLIVDDFDKAKTELLNLVEKYKGELSKSDLHVSPGSPKSGVWKLRVPVAVFNPFCDDVQKLGDVDQFSTDSKDVTAEYYDTALHLESRKKYRASVLKTIDQADNVKDAAPYYQMLGEVDTEIERMEGQLKLLTNLTDLTTVNLTIRERQKFIKDRPPELVEKPDFSTEAGKTFSDSFQTLKSFGLSLTLFIIGASPWLVVLLVLTASVWGGVRLVRRKPKAPKS